MHLLNTLTGELRQFASSKDVKYAIVSHVWQASPKEQTFHEVREIPRLCKERTAAGEVVDTRDLLSNKLRACCRVAYRAGYEWMWVDTCCIDHHSSAELSEAINSMFMWYTDAQVCYVYLHDVGDNEDPSARGSAFRRSVWHTRGWTLQELLAPACVVFLSRTWRTLGSKYSLALALVEVTGIRHDILTRAQSNWLEKASVAERMSWAAHRRTTRVEDRAYSLMGIFGINMPTIYGEGPRAFIRLQEEILRRIPDQSIFAWGQTHPSYSEAAKSWIEEDTGDDVTTDAEGDYKKAPVGEAALTLDVQPRLEDLLASSPSDFANCAGIKALSISEFQNKLDLEGKIPQYSLTSYGVLVQLYVSIRFIDSGRVWARRTGCPPAPRPIYAAILACSNKDKKPIVLLLRPTHHTASLQYSVGEYVHRVDESDYYRCALYPELQTGRKNRFTFSQAKDKSADWQLQEIYIRHDYSTLTLGRVQSRVHQETETAPVIKFHIPQWRLNSMLTHQHLSVRAPSADGLTLRIPFEKTSHGAIEPATSSVQFLHTVLREIITLRIGVGCTCVTKPKKQPEGNRAIGNFWADVRVARIANPGHAQSYGEVLPHIVPAGTSSSAILKCGRAHFRASEGATGEGGPLTLVFGNDDKKLQIRITYAEGFDPAEATWRTSYVLSIDLSGALYKHTDEVSGEDENATDDLGFSDSGAQLDSQAVDAATGHLAEQPLSENDNVQSGTPRESSEGWTRWFMRGLRRYINGSPVNSVSLGHAAE